MSNIAFITTRKYVKSYDMAKLLQKINTKRFGGKLVITQGYEGAALKKSDDKANAWKIGHQDCWDYLWLHQDAPKKLACKHPHNPWMSYVHIVIQEELAKLTSGILSDEGVEGHWKPKPHKYPSYTAWIDLLYSRSKEKEPEFYKSIFDLEMSHAPKGMENY